MARASFDTLLSRANSSGTIDECGANGLALFATDALGLHKSRGERGGKRSANQLARQLLSLKNGEFAILRAGAAARARTRLGPKAPGPTPVRRRMLPSLPRHCHSPPAAASWHSSAKVNYGEAVKRWLHKRWRRLMKTRSRCCRNYTLRSRARLHRLYSRE